MSAVDLAVFDMMGTTIEDDGQVTSAFKSALEHSGVPVAEEEIRERMGSSKKAVIRFFVERHYGSGSDNLEEKIEHIHADFNRSLGDYYAERGARPIEGVEETLSWLRERRIQVALTTGFDRVVTDAILHAVGWHDNAIDVSVCNDDVLQGRPAPFMIFRAMELTGITEVNRVIVAGDTVQDLQAGTNAGVRTVVGTLTGVCNVEQLGEVRHTHILSSLAALPVLIENELS